MMVVLALIATLLQAPGWQDSIEPRGWVRGGGNSDGSIVLMLKTHSPGRVWARWEASEEPGDDSPLSRVELYQADCAEQTIRRLQATSYRLRNMDGRSQDIPMTGEREYVIPGSFGETIAAAACLPDGYTLEDVPAR